MTTTKITMLRNPAKSLGCDLMEGETGEVETAVAHTVVRMGIAVVVDAPKAIQAIPEPPVIMAAVVETPATTTEEPKPQGRHTRGRQSFRII